MNHLLNDTAPSALVQVIETNLIEFFSLFSGWPQAEVYDGEDLFWTITDVPFPLFNSILRTRLAPDSVDDTIESAITRARLRNVPLLWWTGPASRPSDLEEYLIKHNFKFIGDSPGMAVDLLALNVSFQPQPELIIRTVNDKDTLRIWSDILTRGFGLPEYAGNGFFDFFSTVGFGEQSPIRHYIGWLNEEPVAVSSLFSGKGVAGVYNLTTVPNLRRQGIGSAMLMKPLRHARGMGYRFGILQASEMGVSVYRRIGFKEYCILSHYLWTDEAPVDKESKTGIRA